MSVYRFFGTSGHILVSQWHFGIPCDVFLALWVTLGLRFVILGAPLWHPGVHFVTLGVHLGGFLWIWGDLGAPLWYPWAPFGHPWGTLAHFLEKGVKKGHKWTSNWTSKWDGFRYIFDIFIILRVLWRELGGHLFLGIFLAVFSGIPGSGIWS